MLDRIGKIEAVQAPDPFRAISGRNGGSGLLLCQALLPILLKGMQGKVFVKRIHQGTE